MTGRGGDPLRRGIGAQGGGWTPPFRPLIAPTPPVHSPASLSGKQAFPPAAAAARIPRERSLVRNLSVSACCLTAVVSASLRCPREELLKSQPLHCMNDARLQVMLLHNGLATLPDVPVAHAIVAKHTPTVYSTRARPGTLKVDPPFFLGGD